MLPDYEIQRVKTKFEKGIPFIEFALLLLIIQAILVLFLGGPIEEGETIRFRLLAHSDAPADQQVKREIQQAIQPFLDHAITTSKSFEELETNLLHLEEKMMTTAQSLSGKMPISLERKQALFPPKRSGMFIYPQAKYDAYILTIGSGRGDNWWCAMFPKICFPDQEKEKDEKVTFFIWEWIKGVFS